MSVSMPTQSAEDRRYLSPIDIARPPFQTQFLEALHECFHAIVGHASETSVLIDEVLK